jgi:hypothetical protein
MNYPEQQTVPKHRVIGCTLQLQESSNTKMASFCTITSSDDSTGFARTGLLSVSTAHEPAIGFGMSGARRLHVLGRQLSLQQCTSESARSSCGMLRGKVAIVTGDSSHAVPCQVMQVAAAEKSSSAGLNISDCKCGACIGQCMPFGRYHGGPCRASHTMGALKTKAAGGLPPLRLHA